MNTLIDRWQSLWETNQFIAIIVASAFVAVLTVWLLKKKLSKINLSLKARVGASRLFKTSAGPIAVAIGITFIGAIVVTYLNLWIKIGIALLALIVLAALVIGIRILLKKKTEAGGNASSGRWEEVRTHVLFALLWALIIGVVNYALYRIHTEWWLALRNYEGTASLWWLVNAWLIVGISFAVNSKHKSIKGCGVILFIVGISSWTAVWMKTPRPPNVPPADQVPTAIVQSRGPESRWSDAHTFKVKRVEWSPRLSPKLYEAEEGNVEIMLDGNPSDILYWTVRSASSNAMQVKVPAHVKFIQIRSVEKDITVYGTPVEPTKSAAL